MAKGKGLVLDNIGQVIEGVRCDADGNGIERDTMCVSANDMMRVCGGCPLVIVTAGVIADVPVWVVRRDHASLKVKQIVAPGRNSMTIKGTTKEDNIYGSCMILKREGKNMVSLGRSEARAIMATAGIYQFDSDGGRTSFCLEGLELD